MQKVLGQQEGGRMAAKITAEELLKATNCNSIRNENTTGSIRSLDMTPGVPHRRSGYNVAATCPSMTDTLMRA